MSSGAWVGRVFTPWHQAHRQAFPGGVKGGIHLVPAAQAGILRADGFRDIGMDEGDEGTNDHAAGGGLFEQEFESSFLF